MDKKIDFSTRILRIFSTEKIPNPPNEKSIYIWLKSPFFFFFIGIDAIYTG